MIPTNSILRQLFSSEQMNDKQIKNTTLAIPKLNLGLSSLSETHLNF